MKNEWKSPNLVVKPVDETKAGTGAQNDGQWELQS